MPSKRSKYSRGRAPTVHNKRDENEPEILDAFAQLGVDWQEAGPLDGWVYIGENIPVEIKMPGKGLTDREAEYISLCLARGRPFVVLYTVGQAVQWVVERRALVHARAKWAGPELPATGQIAATMDRLMKGKP